MKQDPDIATLKLIENIFLNIKLEIFDTLSFIIEEVSSKF